MVVYAAAVAHDFLEVLEGFVAAGVLAKVADACEQLPVFVAVVPSIFVFGFLEKVPEDLVVGVASRRPGLGRSRFDAVSARSGRGGLRSRSLG